MTFYVGRSVVLIEARAREIQTHPNQNLSPPTIMSAICRHGIGLQTPFPFFTLRRRLGNKMVAIGKEGAGIELAGCKIGLAHPALFAGNGHQIGPNGRG